MSDNYANLQKNYFLRINDTECGPFPEEQVRDMISSGQVDANTPAWVEGLPTWQTVGALFGSFAEPQQTAASVDATMLAQALQAPVAQVEEPKKTVDPMQQIIFWLKVCSGVGAATLAVLLVAVFTLEPARSPGANKTNSPSSSSSASAEELYEAGLVAVYGDGSGNEHFGYMEDAAAAGHMKAQYVFGCRTYDRSYEGRYIDAAKYWKKAAAQGHASAMLRLAEAYLEGEGVRPSKKNAADYAAAAYQKGLIDGKHITKLAPLIIQKLNLPAPIAEVLLSFDPNEDPDDDNTINKDKLKPLQKLAKTGDMWAQFLCAFAENKVQEKVKFLTKAAEQGHILAQVALARYYLEMMNDPETAYRWCKMADDQGCAEAQALLWQIRIKMDETI